VTLANRTALAAGICGLLAAIVAAGVASVLFDRSLSQRVDDQLRQRAESAPVLAAVGDRIGISELVFAVDGARVATGSETVELGPLPSSGLPPLEEPGWRTVEADGESWRLLAVEVRNVPDPGDRALVELVEPLGDVTTQLRTLRRRTATVGAVTAAVVAVLGLLAGRRAARPLTELAAEVGQLGRERPAGWKVTVDTSTPEVDEIATALNDSLGQLAVASRRREEALAAARSFASAASHEMRTPLQSAMLNLDLARAERTDPHLETARTDLDRMRTALDAVRRLSEADLIDARSFEAADVVDVVDQAVGALASEARDTRIDLVGPDRCPRRVWVDGLRLAVENLLRNALRHGRPPAGTPAHIVVTVTDDASIVVDDNGPGIAPADRARVVRAFERGSTSGPGSGLGLAFAQRVAALHGGDLEITDGPRGGARVVLQLGPDPDPHHGPGPGHRSDRR
jgi:two-component system sensor histidine kinase PrrB